MDNYYINLKDVHLYYPSALFNARTLKQTVFQLIRLQKPAKLLKDVHALCGIDLNIRSGEKLGIIGRNGAGKSTLLKTIAGIYPIASGELQTKGNIRSLFDLFLGFEMEATGRENIMYRGLLLGEDPQSILEKTEEIINFAELGEFIDYPMRSYSAGMNVRLAFAISTFVYGDILLLDEVFSVGDAAFVNKARTKIKQLMQSSKIMVFVAHDHKTVREVCNRVIWLDKGKIIADGEPGAVIEDYIKTVVR